MTSFWQNLSERERWLILAGGALGAVFLVLQLIISPILDWRNDQRQRMNEAKAVYELVAEAAPRGRAIASAAAASNTTPVRNAVTQSANAAGVSIVFVNTRADGAVDANIASASPAALYQWVQMMRNEYGVVVESADIARETGNPEVVRAQLSVSRRGGP
jgi:type II secretory pathway component PulM